MGIIIVAVLLMTIAIGGGLVRIHWDVIAPILLVSGLGFVALVAIRILYAILSKSPTPEVKPQTPIPATVADSIFVPDDAEAPIWDRMVSGSAGTLAWEIGEEEQERPSEEIAEQLLRLRLELAKAKAVADAFDGPAIARIRGRAHEWRGHSLSLAVEDGEGFQRLSVRVPDEDDRQGIRVGDRVDLACTWNGGRLAVERVITVEPCEEPFPDLPEPAPRPGAVPDWFDAYEGRGKRDLLKASDGSSSVSELRVHLVWATKRRGKVLTAAMVERLKTLSAEVVEAKGLGRLLAVNCEADHVHVALHLPANLAGSEAAGIIKSYTARLLRREFPLLRAHDDEALWQRGCFVGSIGSGGDLSSVLRYIASQDAPQEDQEGEQNPGEGEETGAA